MRPRSKRDRRRSTSSSPADLREQISQEDEKTRSWARAASRPSRVFAAVAFERRLGQTERGMQRPWPALRLVAPVVLAAVLLGDARPASSQVTPPVTATVAPAPSLVTGRANGASYVQMLGR